MKNLPDDRALPEEHAAASLAGQLRASQCPSKVSARQLASCVETEYCVYVPRSLVHRARWIVAQLPPSDEELESLALRATPPAD